MYEERFCQCLKENEVLIGPPLYWGLYTLQKTHFGAAFLRKMQLQGAVWAAFYKNTALPLDVYLCLLNATIDQL